jgi:hypothetical protein
VTTIVRNIEDSCYADDSCSDEETAGTEDDRLLQFLSGYVAMKAISQKRCENCTNTLICRDDESNSGISVDNSLLQIRNYHNVLHYPSNSLSRLVSFIEKYITAEIGCENISSLSPDTFPKILDALCTAEIPFIGDIGCHEHRLDLLSFIVRFYLILRMYFICKQYNNSIKNIGKAKELRKMGKLIQGNKGN